MAHERFVIDDHVLHDDFDGDDAAEGLALELSSRFGYVRSWYATRPADGWAGGNLWTSGALLNSVVERYRQAPQGTYRGLLAEVVGDQAGNPIAVELHGADRVTVFPLATDTPVWAAGRGSWSGANRVAVCPPATNTSAAVKAPSAPGSWLEAHRKACHDHDSLQRLWDAEERVRRLADDLPAADMLDPHDRMGLIGAAADPDPDPDDGAYRLLCAMGRAADAAQAMPPEQHPPADEPARRQAWQALAGDLIAINRGGMVLGDGWQVGVRAPSSSEIAAVFDAAADMLADDPAATMRTAFAVGGHADGAGARYALLTVATERGLTLTDTYQEDRWGAAVTDVAVKLGAGWERSAGLTGWRTVGGVALAAADLPDASAADRRRWTALQQVAASTRVYAEHGRPVNGTDVLDALDGQGLAAALDRAAAQPDLAAFAAGTVWLTRDRQARRGLVDRAAAQTQPADRHVRGVIPLLRLAGHRFPPAHDPTYVEQMLALAAAVADAGPSLADELEGALPGPGPHPLSDLTAAVNAALDKAGEPPPPARFDLI